MLKFAAMPALPLIAILSAPSAANAGEWAWVGSGEQIRVGMDRATISTSFDMTTAWVVTVYPTKQTIGQYVYDYRVEQRSFSCSRRTQGVSFIALYNLEGQQIHSQSGEAVPSPIIPDTTGDQVLKAACDARGISGPFYASSWIFASSMVANNF